MAILTRIKNNSLFGFVLFVVLLLLFPLPFLANAQELPRLEVTFNPNPLFSEQSILPGDSVTGEIAVTNNTGEDQEVVTEAINVLDPDLLSNNMSLIITDDESTVVYEDVFNIFLTSGPQVLTPALSDSETIVYTYEVSFLEEAGNDTQKAELGFDLCVGFTDEISGMNCGGTTVGDEQGTDTDSGGTGGGTVVDEGSGGSGGGGGGPFTSTPLIISNERVNSINEAGNTAIIVWDTNLFSTSQVVYGPSSGGPYSLSAVETNFGYPLSTTEDGIKVVSHSVQLVGLTPGVEYLYRVVSRASPPTVSFEHTFIAQLYPEASATPPSNTISSVPDSQDQSQSTGGSGGQSSPSSNSQIIGGQVVAPNSAGGGTNSGDSTFATTTDTNASSSQDFEEIVTTDNNGDNPNLALAGEAFAAAAFFSGFFGGDGICLKYFVFILLLIVIVQLLWSKLAYGFYTHPVGKKVWYVGLLLSGIIMLLVREYCVLPFLIFTALIVWGLQFFNKENDIEEDEQKILHKDPL